MGMGILAYSLGIASPAATIAQLNYRLPPPQPVRDSCRTGDPEEIVVCGRRDSDRFRLGEAAPPRNLVLRRSNPFELDLGGRVRAVPTVSQINRPDGWVDHRIMLNFRIPF